MSAYVLDEPAFNVNNGEIYRAMTEHVQQFQPSLTAA